MKTPSVGKIRSLVFGAKKRPGDPPGTMVYGGQLTDEPVRLSLIEYDEEDFFENPDASVEECAASLENSNITWVNVQGLHDVELIERLGGVKGIHRLVLEDVVHMGQRPKSEQYPGSLFVVTRMLTWDTDSSTVKDEQVSLVYGRGFVFSFQEKVGDVFEPVRDRLRRARVTIRSRGADYLGYALVDAVVDHYFEVIRQIGDRIEEIEDTVFSGPDPTLVEDIHRLRRETMLVRGSIWPLREVLSSLYREEVDFIEEDTRLFYRDVYDHSVQVMDTLEALREVVGGLMDLYLTGVSNRMNEVMQVLTIIATIFIPLSFLAGVYGMNFEVMPELGYRWAYPTLLIIMATAAAGMLLLFRRRGWF